MAGIERESVHLTTGLRMGHPEAFMFGFTRRTTGEMAGSASGGGGGPGSGQA